MTSNITQLADKQPEATATAQLFEDWFDPIEATVRAQAQLSNTQYGVCARGGAEH